MIFEKRELKIKCIEDGKAHYIRFIDKFLRLQPLEKEDIKLEIMLDKFIEKPLFEEEENIFQRLWRKIKNNLPWIIHSRKWYKAFQYFYKLEQKEIEKIHIRMGLPKNGIRKDDC